MIPALIVLLQSGDSFLFAHEKTYTAIVVVGVILSGLIGFLALTNRRVSKLENELNRKVGGKDE